MKIIIGEDWISLLDRMRYRGMIGLAYESTLDGVLAYIVFGLFCIFAIVGFITVMKILLFGRAKKEDPGKKWLRTGKFD